jgi:formylmethanofuran dehydrogenase subunit E
MNICSMSVEEFEQKAAAFHGRIAPGMLIGGFMVDLATKNLPPGEFFDVICESGKCLPDSVQILTPCSIGNGWLQVLKIGRFALTFFEKVSGNGIRVYLDPQKLASWPEIDEWFLRRVPKEKQDTSALLAAIKRAGTKILSKQTVTVDISRMERRKGQKVALCPSCGEAFPAEHGVACRACRGEITYLIPSGRGMPVGSGQTPCLAIGS